MSIRCKVEHAKGYHGLLRCLIIDQEFPLQVDKNSFRDENQFQNFDEIFLLQIENSKMEKIPKGLGKVFPNIQILKIVDSGLNSICKEDLENFTELSYLGAIGNSIELVPGDLFKFSKEIKEINFCDNKIKFIGLDLLEGLEKFKWIDFGRDAGGGDKFFFKYNLDEAKNYFRTKNESSKGSN